MSAMCKDLAAVLTVFATWAGVCLIAVAWPAPNAVTAMAAVVAIAVTGALTPRDAPTTRKGGAR